MTRLYEQITADWINLSTTLISFFVVIAGILYIILYPRLAMLGIKNLRRNLTRTLLTMCAIAVFASMITIIWTVLYFIKVTTAERAKDLKVIVSYRSSVPSQMPMTHGDYLNPASPKFLPELVDEHGKKLYTSSDFMLWSFYEGTTDPAKRTPDNTVSFIAVEPDQIIPMMDDMENLDPRLVELLTKSPQGCLLGSERMKSLNKRVGERIKLTSISHEGIDLDFEIVGPLPEGEYSSSAIMRLDYFNNAFDLYARNNKRAHPLAQRRLDMIWIRVGDRALFKKIGNIVQDAPQFHDFPVKIETASSLNRSSLEAYRTIFFAMRFILAPGILAVMALVMANAIGITVRERRSEMAVMKVLGYRPNQVMGLILGEAMLSGALAGLIAAGATFFFFNFIWGGVPFLSGVSPLLRIPEASMMWGMAIGAVTTFIGAAIPAWTARNVSVSEVFSRVT
jgi:putative ABC transport system permease protein